MFWVSPRLETPQSLWATCSSVWQTYILNRKLSRCCKTTPTQTTLFPESKNLVWSKSLQAVSYKRLKQNPTQFRFPNNGLQEIFLGGKITKQTHKWMQELLHREHFHLYFPKLVNFPTFFHRTSTLPSTAPQALVLENLHLPCSCSNNCRASTPLLPEGPAPSSDTDSPSKSKDDTELERFEGPVKTDFTVNLSWKTVPKYTTLTIQDTIT